MVFNVLDAARSGSRTACLRMENSGKKLPKKRGGAAGKNPGSESHTTTTEFAQYESAVHQAKTSGIVSNEHFIKRDCGLPFSGPLKVGAACSVPSLPFSFTYHHGTR